METVEIQKGVPFEATLTITDESVSPAVALDITGLTVFISVKRLKDSLSDDSAAVISSKITVHDTPASGITTWALTPTETNVSLGRYKCDVRVYTDATDFINSGSFIVEVVDVVTKRTS